MRFVLVHQCGLVALVPVQRYRAHHLAWQRLDTAAYGGGDGREALRARVAHPVALLHVGEVGHATW